MRAALKFSILSFVFIGLVACAPKSENNSFENAKVQFTYQPRNEDREFNSTYSENFSFADVSGLTAAQNSTDAWVANSADLFRFAENSIVLGNKIGGSASSLLGHLGHDILRLFYSSKSNSTQFGQTNSMYLPAALGFEGESIKVLFEEIATEKNISGSKNTLRGHHIIWPSEQPTLRPIGFINSIKTYLEGISVEMKRSGVDEAFINIFKSQLERDYLGAIRNAQKSLHDIDENQMLEINAQVISDVIKTLSFIPKSAIAPLQENLVRAQEYAEAIKPAKNETHANRLVRVIANIWLDLNAQQREKYIRPSNEMLYEKMNSTSSKMINWLAGKTTLSLTDKEYYYGKFFKDGFADRLGTSCHSDVEIELRQWATMNDVQKVAFRNSHPDLFSIFSRYSPREIQGDILVHFEDSVFNPPLTNGSVIRKFIGEIKPICITRIQHLLDGSINLYLLSELDIEIRRLGSKIEEVVAEKTLGSLNEIAESVESPEKFKDFFAKMASPILNEMLFEGDTLNGIEDSRVQLVFNSNGDLEARKAVANSSSEYVTGAETLGTSMAASYYRFLGMPQFEGHSPLSKGYYKTVFSQINKMISMIGFRTIDNKLVPSLHRNMVGGNPNFDVFKYECSPKKKEVQDERKARYEAALREKRKPDPNDFVGIREDCTGYENYSRNIFQIPDELPLTGAFVGAAGKKYSSIRAQAEIIRGGALMLNYFNDWRGPGDFDKGLGQEAYSDIELFPKSAFVNLAVAVMTGPLRGLQKENSALKLFNALGEEMKDWAANGLPDPSKVDPNNPLDPKDQITGAVVVDLLPHGPSSTVKSLDMAAFMVAIDEFLKATDGIEKTQATVINPPDRTVKDNMEAILHGRKLLKLMMFSMANFLMTNFQDEDGGFWGQYSLAAKKVDRSKPRDLETQLTIIEALLKTYGRWGGEVAAITAVEVYHFMNQNLWNDETSFYSFSETHLEQPIAPHLYVQTLLTMKNIVPFLQSPQSSYQANRMFDYYSKAFLEWSQTN